MSANNRRNNTKRLSRSPPQGAPTAPRAMREQQAFLQRVAQQRAGATSAAAEASRGAGPVAGQGQGGMSSFLPLLPSGQPPTPGMHHRAAQAPGAMAPSEHPYPNPQRNASAESQQPTAGQYGAAHPSFFPAQFGDPNDRRASADMVHDSRRNHWLTTAPEPETEEQKAEREKAERIDSARHQYETGRSFEDDDEFFSGNGGNRSRKAYRTPRYLRK
ncbi:hypothetical protein PG987_001512 [Apiospora arundinis]